MSGGPYREKPVQVKLEMTKEEIIEACREWMALHHPDKFDSYAEVKFVQSFPFNGPVITKVVQEFVV